MSDLHAALMRSLAAWDPRGLPITSLYLTVDGRRYPRRSDYEVRLGELLRDARAQAGGLDRDAARSVERDLEHMSGFVRGEFGRGDTRGIALFSSSGAALWEEVRVPRPVRDRTMVAAHPDLLPLEALLETYRSTCAILVDAEKARVFVVELGRIDEVTQILDEVPGRHDQGGWSQPRMQRHIDVHRHDHLKRVADEVFRLWKRRGFEHVILAGPGEAPRELEPLLHDYLRRRVRARLPMEMLARTEEVRARALEVEESIERESERAKTEQVAAAAASGDRGVIGLEPALSALGEGRASELVVALDLSAPGWSCPACGRLTVSAGRCPSCGSSTEAAPDVVEAAVARAFRNGCRVEIVGEEGAFAELGGIGALLRF